MRNFRKESQEPASTMPATNCGRVDDLGVSEISSGICSKYQMKRSDIITALLVLLFVTGVA
jgi:hypothetical protein